MSQTQAVNERLHGGQQLITIFGTKRLREETEQVMQKDDDGIMAGNRFTQTNYPCIIDRDKRQQNVMAHNWRLNTWAYL